MKRDQIIQESLGLFMQFGIRSVSMDDVCRKLGMSKKTLYNYVDSKGDLVRLSVEAYQNEECATMKKISADAENALEAMVNIGRYIIGVVKKLKPGVVYDLQKYYRNVHDKWESEHSDLIQQQLVQNMELGIEQGLYRSEIDVEIVARLYVAKVQTIMNEKVFPADEFRQEEVVRQNFIYHLHGILTQKGLEKMYGEDLLNLNLNS